MFLGAGQNRMPLGCAVMLRLAVAWKIASNGDFPAEHTKGKPHEHLPF